MCTNRRLAGSVWCGLCYENLRGRASHKGHLGYRQRRAVDPAPTKMPIRKPTAEAPVRTSFDASSGSYDMIIGPVTLEYVTDEKWEDGTPRVPCSLLLFHEMGKWKVCINDRGLGRTAWVTSLSPGGALAALEEQLAADTCDWRKARPGRK